MKKLLLIVMACYGLNAGAQVRQSKNFIYLYSDSVIYAESIRLRPDFYNSYQLRADSKRIPVAQVKFFNNEDGFFANTRKLNFARITSFTERIIEGKINLYQQVSYSPSYYDQEYNSGYRFRERREQSVDLRMYYNKAYEDLKKVNYRNLKQDLADNPESMRWLKSYRRSMNTSTILYSAAGASIVASMIMFLTDGKKKPDNNGFGNGLINRNTNPNNFGANVTGSYLLMGAGLGFAIGGYTVGASGSRKLESAIDAYNR